jgi:MFS family permease
MRKSDNPGNPSSPHRGGVDRFSGALTAVLFSVAMGIASVAVPLLAVSAGHSAAQVGVVIASSAVAQMVTRPFLGLLMRRLPDKALVLASAGFMAVSCALVGLSEALLALYISQLLQGVARALFWTGSQTHAVRGSKSAVGALTLVNLAAGFGSLVGPVLAGLLSQTSTDLALWCATGVAALALPPALLLTRHPVFAARLKQDRHPQRVWRRPGVDIACWMSISAGAWRGLLNSYIPVVLAHAGQSAPLIGFLVSLANGAALLGSALARYARNVSIGFSLVFGVFSAGIGVSVLGLLAGSVPAAAAALIVSGIGAGILQTVGPAIAAESVDPDETGEAIASTGTFRAVALFSAPVAAAALVTFVPISVALLVTGLVIAVPAAGWRRGPGETKKFAT